MTELQSFDVDLSLPRCAWPGVDPLYVHYHDNEWGVPEWDSRALFEKLLLDGFQAGLSWITILRKREAFRDAFCGFNPEKIAVFTPQDVERLMQNAGIVRNRAKITAAINSAKSYIAIEEKEGFDTYLWKYLDGQPIQNEFTTFSQVPAQTPLSQTISKQLLKDGFKFVGPTIVYAFMQAVGMVNDHLISCHCHEKCKHLRQKP